MSECAYCKRESTATREHVIPAFLYNFQRKLDESIIGWNEVAKKMVGGEHKIKDVCADCNNEKLSALDAYGKGFLTPSGFLCHNYSKLSADLSYDYDLLVRWLLKISFNSSRTDKAHSPLLERFIPYILDGVHPPCRRDLAVVAALAAPTNISQLKGEYPPLESVAGASGRINPFFVRIAYGPNHYKSFTLRIVMFGPLIFFMLVFLPGVLPGHASIEIKRFLKNLPKGVEIHRNRKRAYIDVGTTTWLDYYTPQVLRVKSLKHS